jgi:hypothetical protein
MTLEFGSESPSLPCETESSRPARTSTTSTGFKASCCIVVIRHERVIDKSKKESCGHFPLKSLHSVEFCHILYASFPTEKLHQSGHVIYASQPPDLASCILRKADDISNGYCQSRCSGLSEWESQRWWSSRRHYISYNIFYFRKGHSDTMSHARMV